MTVYRVTGTFDNRAIALVALKRLRLDDGIKYHGKIIERTFEGYRITASLRYPNATERIYASALTVLAVADGLKLEDHPVYTWTCGACGRDYETESVDRTYCSRACKQRAYRARIKAAHQA